VSHMERTSEKVRSMVLAARFDTKCNPASRPVQWADVIVDREYIKFSMKNGRAVRLGAGARWANCHSSGSCWCCSTASVFVASLRHTAAYVAAAQVGVAASAAGCRKQRGPSRTAQLVQP
jgi:hypothetical protein